jgi:hypothetical protein
MKAVVVLSTHFRVEWLGQFAILKRENAPRLVREGHLKVARQFIAGFVGKAFASRRDA